MGHARTVVGAPTDGLVVLRDTPVHRLPGHVGVVTLVAFSLVVVATPAGAWGVLAVDAALLAAVVAAARIPPRLVARRATVEVPFLVFAALLPVVALGERVAVGTVSLSRDGIVGAGTLAAKATLGVVAAIVLAATTPARELLAGLDRLRLPRTLVAILGFMVRYSAIVGEHLRRLHVARVCRGGPGGPRALAAAAGGAGLTFVRAYERGERVHRAMQCRGYAGRMPPLGSAPATPAQWASALALPGLAAVALAVSQVAR